MPNTFSRGLRESKQYSGFGVLVALILILVVSLYVTNTGINDYHRVLEEKEDFKKFEKLFFKGIRSYLIYSFYGFKVLFDPSSNRTLFSILPGMRDLSARINSTIELAIYTNSKKRGLRDVGGTTQARFSDIAFWLGSLFFIFFGFDLFRRRSYLKFLSGNASYPWVFFWAIVTRAVLSVLGIFVIFGCNIALVLFRGVRLTPADVSAMPGYLVVLSAMLLFFFTWGTFIGSVFPNWKGISALIIIWFSFVYLIPKGLYSLALTDHNDKSSPYRLDSEKKHIVNDFEINAKKKYGKYGTNSAEAERKIIEGYYNNESKQLAALEEQKRQEIVREVEAYNKLALLTPTSFYILTVEEISSGGFSHYAGFYEYLIKLWRQFVRFWFDRVYYHDPKDLKNFIQKDENIFNSRSRLPVRFNTGVGLSWVWVLLLLTGTYLVSKRTYAGLKKEAFEELGDVNQELDKGKINCRYVAGIFLSHLLYNLLTGRNNRLVKMGFQGTVMLNGKDIVKERNIETVFYLPHPDHVADDIKVKLLVRSVAGEWKVPASEVKTILESPELKDIASKTFGQLRKEGKKERQLDVLLALVRLVRADVYLIDDVLAGFPVRSAIKLYDIMEPLCKEAVVICLVDKMKHKGEEIEGNLPFEDGRSWLNWVQSEKHRKEQ